MRLLSYDKRDPRLRGDDSACAGMTIQFCILLISGIVRKGAVGLSHFVHVFSFFHG